MNDFQALLATQHKIAEQLLSQAENRSVTDRQQAAVMTELINLLGELTNGLLALSDRIGEVERRLADRTS
jgi:hypothetical protein